MHYVNRNNELFLWLTFIRMFLMVNSQNTSNNQLVITNDNVWFDPPDALLLPEGSKVNISWFTTLKYITNVTYHVEDELVSSVRTFHEHQLSITNGSDNEFYSVSNSNYTYHGTFETQAKFIGFNKIYVTMYDESDQVVVLGKIKATVILSYQKLNDMFTLAIGCLALLVYVTMGATLDMDIIVQVIKKPIGPIIALICQYVAMPLIGYGLGVLFFPNDPLLRLGLFLSGCSPGGGLSNMWTILLGGSVDLSIMMTLVSSFAAFGTVPLWVFTMGPLILDDHADFVIPYMKITIAMASLAISSIIGLTIQRFLPKVAAVLQKVVTPLSLFHIIFILSLGIYSYRYCFVIATWEHYLAGFALPVIGYFSGFLAAVLFKRNVADVIAIAIETGIQNYTIALFIMKFSLESPAGELSAVIPVSSFIMVPGPLFLAVLVKKGYEWKMNSHQKDATKDIINNEKQMEMVHATGIENPVVDIQE